MQDSYAVALFLNSGLLGAFCIAMVEKFAPMIPSYVTLMLLGMTASDGACLVMTILATATGSLVSSIGWYGIGRVLGEERVEAAVARFGKYAFLSSRAYGRLACAYRRNRFWVTLMGQTVPVARVYLALPAGVLKLRPASFTAATALGILLWNTPFLTLGYALRGSNHDPVNVGFWASIALIGLEMTILLGLRLHRSMTK